MGTYNYTFKSVVFESVKVKSVNFIFLILKQENKNIPFKFFLQIQLVKKINAESIDHSAKANKASQLLKAS